MPNEKDQDKGPTIEPEELKIPYTELADKAIDEVFTEHEDDVPESRKINESFNPLLKKQLARKGVEFLGKKTK